MNVEHLNTKNKIKYNKATKEGYSKVRQIIIPLSYGGFFYGQVNKIYKKVRIKYFIDKNFNHFSLVKFLN